MVPVSSGFAATSSVPVCFIVFACKVFPDWWPDVAQVLSRLFISTFDILSILVVIYPTHMADNMLFK